MILSELRTYLQTHRRATLSDMALRFGSDPDALRGMLSKWISKGSVVKLLAAKPCGTCCKCDPLAMEIYEWRDQRGLERNSPVRTTVMMKDTLLVIGIHRDELGFGDRVAAHIDPSRFDLMRIPQGIPQAKTSPRERFYSSAQHREIYLQLHQQVHNRYRLLIDLHRGLDEAGRSADVFSHDERFLKCLAHKSKYRGFKENVRLVHIASTDERVEPSGAVSVADAEAKTWIPHRVWLGTSPLYVGLEIYLATNSDGEEEDWEFARMLISEIQTCEPRQQETRSGTMTENELNRFLDLRRHMKIAHHIPGRIRLKIGRSALKELGTVNKSDVEGFLNEIDGIKEVRINEAAGSVVISYAPGSVAPERWEELMHADRKQAAPLLESMMKPGITNETLTTATTTATTFG